MSKISSILFRLKHDSSYFPVQAEEDINKIISEARKESEQRGYMNGLKDQVELVRKHRER